MTEGVVLDASALLAFLHGEPGWDEVGPTLPGALISTMNLSEVAAKLVEAGNSDDEVTRIIDAMALDIVPFDTELAMLAGLLRRSTRRIGLSLGDRACLALASKRGAVALTADKSWTNIGDPSILVRMIR